MVKDSTCKNKNWRKDDLEKAVYEEIKRLADNPHLLYELKKIPSENTDGNIQKVRGQIADINAQIGKLMDLYQSNDSTIQVDDVAQRIDELYQEKVNLLQINAPKGSSSDRYTKLFDVERARLIIAELPAAMREDNIDISEGFTLPGQLHMVIRRRYHVDCTGE